MPPASARQRGSAAIAYVVALSMTMSLFVMCMNVLAVTYAKGTLRGALDEGVRSAAVVGGTRRDCENRVREVLSDLLAGPMGSRVHFRCALSSAVVEASATASFPGWLPGVPTAHLSLEAQAERERGVGP